MKNYTNKKGFSLVIAIGLVLVMSLMAYFILDYMVPFGKNIKGIENSTNAYYQAENGIEDALFKLNSLPVGAETSIGFTTDAIDYKFDMTASGTRLPPFGEGNSGFDKDWNRIKSGEPIQLEIGYAKIKNKISNFQLYFRVPDLDKGGTLIETLSGDINTPYTPIINWQLTSNDNTLNASGSWITNDDINDITNTGSTAIVFTYKDGVDLDGTGSGFTDYYDHNCGAGSGCILKMSIINKLELKDNNTPIPYLEWVITAGSNIPLRYSHIATSGKSYGFKKDLKIKVPQQTVNEAFDFTVFQ